MKIITDTNEAKSLLRQGGTLIYPTEAVYGLGCSPFNKTAVETVLSLKKRTINKGFILLIADWPQLFPLIGSVTDKQLETVQKTWPGFITWVFPKAKSLPPWITGEKETIAIRMTAHTIARALCNEMPIISTSVNLSGQPPIENTDKIATLFGNKIDALVQGKLGQDKQASAIYDVQTGLQLR